MCAMQTTVSAWPLPDISQNSGSRNVPCIQMDKRFCSSPAQQRKVVNAGTSVQGLPERPYLTQAQFALQRAKYAGVCTDPERTLTLLQQLLQKSINAELDLIIKRYLKDFFVPAINNIKQNLGPQSVAANVLPTVSRQILEEAKKQYERAPACKEQQPAILRQTKLVNKHIPLELRQHQKDEDSDTDSEASSCSGRSVNNKRRKLNGNEHYNPDGVKLEQSAFPTQVPRGKQYATPSSTDFQKWNPARITPETVFVLGSKANEALGMGLKRGLIYSKHPNTFRYFCDAQDKQWLCDSNLCSMKQCNKAYFMIMQDIRDLLNLPEYMTDAKVKPQVLEQAGFCLPPFLLQKIKAHMAASSYAQAC